jgi:hypothetical protein
MQAQEEQDHHFVQIGFILKNHPNYPQQRLMLRAGNTSALSKRSKNHLQQQEWR